MAAYRYTRRQRLLKTDEFSSVFSLRQSKANEFFQLWLRPNGCDRARLGVVVAKRVVRHAVGRNFIKRTVREQFRLHAEALSGFDLIVRAKRPVRRSEGAAARAALLKLFSRVGPCRVS